VNIEDSLNFFSPTKGTLDLQSVLKEVALFITNSPSSTHKIIIGTDSQVRKNQMGHYVDYVTAIVVHQLGQGGRYFWRRRRHYQSKIVLRDKIYQEVTYSISFASEFVPAITRVLNGAKYELEIHIDVGNSGPTRELIREVVGMVTGNGYTAKTKPQSYAASSIADRHT
jgi:uncharacterized protein